MPHVMILLLLALGSLLLQLVLLPAIVPPILRPDVFFLLGCAVLVMGPREFGLVALFTLGFCADLFGSARFGLLTVSYLLSAGAALLVLGPSLGRGDVLVGWLTAIAGTALAHASYALLAQLFGWNAAWPQAGAILAGLLISAAVWGLPVMYATGRVFYTLGLMPPEARERWLLEEKLARARQRRVRRA